jgi:restriction system protein
MARRKKDGLADAVVGATALLPWWAGGRSGLSQLPVAAFHSDQTADCYAAIGGRVGGLAITALWHGLATVGQYLLPFLFLLGAGISAYKRHQAKKLHAEAAKRADGVAQGTWRGV